MHTVRADQQKNRLYITIAGMLDLKQAADAAGQCIAAAKTLRPGFDIVNDISQMKPGGDEVTAVIAKAQGEIGKLGPKRVIRVVGKAAVAAMQMNRTAKEAHVAYNANIVATVGDAEALLAKP